MLRRNQTFLRVSPFALYLQELSSAGKLKRATNKCTYAAKLYHKLSPAQKGALRRRAKAKTFPAQVAYQQLVKRETKLLSGIPIKKRQAIIQKKWASFKKSQARASAKAVPSAKKKVKAASTAAKRISKGTQK
ncbi:hypothetical protein LSCM1_02035 [Leishmania martiniquensis]|uniref:Kinetoplast DNA-associated protein n=1 Tax=Leishmania martiniquensis TaxID=1580590 RepID=A0A836H5I6_9TRYP|nr:hypothetical protein LSCM1_02035 [Leishmania martiniquensis]